MKMNRKYQLIFIDADTGRLITSALKGFKSRHYLYAFIRHGKQPPYIVAKKLVIDNRKFITEQENVVFMVTKPVTLVFRMNMIILDDVKITSMKAEYRETNRAFHEFQAREKRERENHYGVSKPKGRVK